MVMQQFSQRNQITLGVKMNKVTQISVHKYSLFWCLWL